jgi:hypothetical protein
MWKDLGKKGKLPFNKEKEKSIGMDKDSIQQKKPKIGGRLLGL